MEVLPGLGFSEEKVECVNLDVKDRKIIAALSENSRIPLTQLAKRVGLSRESVQYRVKRLYERRVLVGSRTIVNAHTLGYLPYHLFFRLKKPGSEVEKKVTQVLCSLGHTRAVLKFHGN